MRTLLDRKSYCLIMINWKVVGTNELIINIPLQIIREKQKASKTKIFWRKYSLGILYRKSSSKCEGVGKTWDPIFYKVKWKDRFCKMINSKSFY